MDSVCILCHELLGAHDPDNLAGVIGPVCGHCVRAKRAAERLHGEIRTLHELWPQAHADAEAAFGHHVTSDTLFEAMCGYIEGWYEERGHSVDVQYETQHDFGRLIGLRFTLTPRTAIERAAYRFTVKL